MFFEIFSFNFQLSFSMEIYFSDLGSFPMFYFLIKLCTNWLVFLILSVFIVIVCFYLFFTYSSFTSFGFPFERVGTNLKIEDCSLHKNFPLAFSLLFLMPHLAAPVAVLSSLLNFL